jgi:hypothetical protein
MGIKNSFSLLQPMPIRKDSIVKFGWKNKFKTSKRLHDTKPAHLKLPWDGLHTL